MTCSPSQSPSHSAALPERERIRTQLLSLLERLGCAVPVSDLPSSDDDAALATALMDGYRKTHDSELFDGLVRWAGPQLRVRVRFRLRSLGVALDPDEVWQDTIVNVYRYPTRFLASRPGAFAAWSSTIIDNAIRKHLRAGKRRLDITLRDPDVLQEQADTSARDPSTEAQHREECRSTASAFRLVLQAYLVAYQRLGERERSVLQMVEVHCMRYAAVAEVVGIRPEAIKMVVFRARKRIHQRLGLLLQGLGEQDIRPQAPGRHSSRPSKMSQGVNSVVAEVAAVA